MIARVVSIESLSSLLKVLVEDDEDLQDLWVDGEISNLSLARSGHAYFTLKDETCAIGAVMWRHALARQSTIPRNGDRVLAHGDMTFYQAQGRIQLQVDVLQPRGTGLLQLRLEETRQRLEAEGLFDPSRKRDLPAFPTRIGVVTSATGAVWHDIQHVVARRCPLAELILAPAIVQGDAAPPSIVEALQRLQDEAAPDVIIVGRGGGSLEDLWAFNDERVVRAIFAARVPVISAVGHETDTTLADYVADLRAPTPSAAAELAVPDLTDLDEDLQYVADRMATLVERRVFEAHQTLDDMAARHARVSPAARVRAFRAELIHRRERLDAAMRHHMRLARREVDAYAEVLDALDPQALMSRGYSFVCNAETGSAIRGIADVREGDTIRAIVHGGEMRATVTNTTSRQEPPGSNR